MEALDYFVKWADNLKYDTYMTENTGKAYTFVDYETEAVWKAYEAGFKQAQEATQEAPQAPVTPVGEASYMPGTEGFTIACFKASDVPGGTKLYKGHPPGYVNHEKIAEFLRSLGYIRNMSASALAEAIADYINDNESVYD